jgi:predicted DsbA family dithiol-disulfide isomerase
MKRLVLALVLGGLMLACAKETPKPAEQPAQPAQPAAAAAVTGEKVKIDLFVMSKCPYGVQVLNTVKDVAAQIGGNLDLGINFIGDDDGQGNFKSMHGDAEVQGDIIELCAIKLFPEKFQYLDFFACINKNWQQLPAGWEPCAAEAKVDAAKLKACIEGPDGKKFLAESFKAAKDQKATGSPTINVGGQRYSGGREVTDFVRAVCDGLKGTKPETCDKLPKPVAFKMTMLSDKRCQECEARVSRMEGQLKSMFPGMTVEKLDYADQAGKDLYAKTQVKYLPAFLFEKAVETDPGYGRLKRWLTPQGEMLNLNVGSKFDPAAEICDNKVDDTGDGKVDCDDDSCKNSLTCRTEMPKKLDLFIMSGCPFGIKALDAMKEVLKAFEADKVDFQVHYIADVQGDGFNSLHGQWEWEENIRELCAFKHGGTQKGMEYAWCRNPSIRDASKWQECAKTAKLDLKKMEACATGEEGKNLLREDIKIAKGLEISASPTWLANNKNKFSGVDAERIKTNLCTYNKDLKGCGKTLSTDTQVQGSCGAN